MPTDPLTLGQQLVAVLEGGHRTATYKLAVMVALLDLAVESVPDDPGAAVSIDLDDLTERVMALYWTQLRPLDEKSHVILRQSNDGRGVVFSQLTALRAASTTRDCVRSRSRAPKWLCTGVPGSAVRDQEKPGALSAEAPAARRHRNL